jgi:hypothetical protein
VALDLYVKGVVADDPAAAAEMSLATFAPQSDEAAG